MTRISLLAAGLVFTAGMALAQQGTPGAHFIEQWDLNGDGQVTLAEAREKRGDVFYMFDANADGIFQPEDWAAIADHLATEEQANGAGLGMGNGPGRIIHAAMEPAFNDTDGNGSVTAQEFIDATDALFVQIDRNGDGLMTTADFGRG